MRTATAPIIFHLIQANCFRDAALSPTETSSSNQLYIVLVHAGKEGQVLNVVILNSFCIPTQ